MKLFDGDPFLFYERYGFWPVCTCDYPDFFNFSDMVSEHSSKECDDSAATGRLKLRARSKKFKKVRPAPRNFSFDALEVLKSWSLSEQQHIEDVGSNFIKEKQSSIVFGTVDDPSFFFPKPIEREDEDYLHDSDSFFAGEILIGSIPLRLTPPAADLAPNCNFRVPCDSLTALTVQSTDKIDLISFIKPFAASTIGPSPSDFSTLHPIAKNHERSVAESMNSGTVITSSEVSMLLHCNSGAATATATLTGLAGTLSTHQKGKREASVDSDSQSVSLEFLQMASHRYLLSSLRLFFCRSPRDIHTPACFRSSSFLDVSFVHMDLYNLNSETTNTENTLPHSTACCDVAKCADRMFDIIPVEDADFCIDHKLFAKRPQRHVDLDISCAYQVFELMCLRDFVPWIFGVNGFAFVDYIHLKFWIGTSDHSASCYALRISLMMGKDNSTWTLYYGLCFGIYDSLESIALVSWQQDISFLALAAIILIGGGSLVSPVITNCDQVGNDYYKKLCDAIKSEKVQIITLQKHVTYLTSLDALIKNTLCQLPKTISLMLIANILKLMCTNVVLILVLSGCDNYELIDKGYCYFNSIKKSIGHYGSAFTSLGGYIRYTLIVVILTTLVSTVLTLVVVGAYKFWLQSIDSLMVWWRIHSNVKRQLFEDHG